MAKQALDTFVAVLADGTEKRVVRGEVYADGHAVVKHAPKLFGDFQDSGPEPVVARRSRKAS